MKKEVLPLISSSNTLNSHSLSKPFKQPKSWLDPKLFMPSLPPILLISVDKAQSSITGAALGLSLSLSNSQSHSRHFHKAPEEEDEEDVISEIRSDFAFSFLRTLWYVCLFLSRFVFLFVCFFNQGLDLPIIYLFFVFQGLVFGFWVNSGLQL